MCRNQANQLKVAAKDKNVRLVAVAKERLGHEEFTRDYWQPPAELYFDTTEPDYPFFKAINGESMGLVHGLWSYLSGGKVAKNMKLAKGVAGNLKGEGLVLGGILVVASSGDILMHHVEKEVGDQPDPAELAAAISQLAAEEKPTSLSL